MAEIQEPAEARRIVDALVRARRGSLVAGVALGGLALIGGLALRALGGGSAAAGPEAAAAPASVPAGEPHPEVSEDEARLMLRAMVAATVADGMVDARERARLDAAVAEAGLERDGQAWLERELADPADVDEIAERVDNPEAAARIYAAARLAIDADTMQERQFLKMLAEALDVPEAATGQVERAVA